MAIRALFSTQIYTAPLGSPRPAALNQQLLLESLQLRRDDRAGRAWSRSNYPGGYTSYNSLCQLQRISPSFAQLELRLAHHVARFARALGLHLHPLATISGTYYVRTPPGCAGLKFEDPRLERFMAAPPRRVNARMPNRAWVTLPAIAGQLVLFESWLRHEVPPNPGAGERVSVSFNF